jgi:alkylhydroperoxidase family enzyme
LVDEAFLPAITAAEWDDDPRFTARERAALRYTDTMWHDHRRVTPELIHTMLDHLSEPEIIELGVMVAQFIGMGQLFAALGIPNPIIDQPHPAGA